MSAIAMFRQLRQTPSGGGSDNFRFAEIRKQPRFSVRETPSGKEVRRKGGPRAPRCNRSLAARIKGASFHTVPELYALVGQKRGLLRRYPEVHVTGQRAARRCHLDFTAGGAGRDGGRDF